MITFGPCQTPTLGFCVQRHDEKLNFKPKLQYFLQLNFKVKDREISANYQSGAIQNETELNKIREAVFNTKDVEVLEFTEKEGIKARPEGLNTIQLLKVCSQTYGIGPYQAMNVAERLYLQGFITYPRTESTHYPTSYGFKDICLSLQNDQHVGTYTQKLVAKGYINPRSGTDMGDHPPITPTINLPKALTGEEERIYEYISRHFLASISRDCKYTDQTTVVKCGNYKFESKGCCPLDAGWMEIMPWHQLNQN